MYDDEKTRKQHYDDWTHIMKRLEGKDGGIVFRRKIIQRLIDDYERSEHDDGGQ